MIFIWEEIVLFVIYFNAYAREKIGKRQSTKKGWEKNLYDRDCFLLNEGYRVCVRCTTKWDPRQECKAIRRMHTGAFCGATKPTLLTTTTSEAKKYPHRQSPRVYPVERGNTAILRRHPYYLLLTMMVLRLPIQTGDSSSKARVSVAFRC